MKPQVPTTVPLVPVPHRLGRLVIFIRYLPSCGTFRQQSNLAISWSWAFGQTWTDTWESSSLVMAIFSSDIKGSPRSGIRRTGIRAVRCVTKPKWDYVKIECSFSHRDNLMGTYQLCLLGGRLGAHTPSLSPLVLLSIL